MTKEQAEAIAIALSNIGLGGILKMSPKEREEIERKRKEMNQRFSGSGPANKESKEKEMEAPPVETSKKPLIKKDKSGVSIKEFTERMRQQKRLGSSG